MNELIYYIYAIIFEEKLGSRGIVILDAFSLGHHHSGSAFGMTDIRHGGHQ